MRHSQDEGFTLLEVVLAVALLAFAASIVFPIFGQVPSRLQAMQVRKEAQMRASSLVEEMSRRGNWANLPTSAASAVWSEVDEGWYWRAYELATDEEDRSKVIAPGRPLRIKVEVRPEGQNSALVELEEIFWVLGGS